MPEAQVSRLIALIGIGGEAAAVLLLALLFFLLRPYAARRSYFLKWANAWVMIAVALAAVMVHYYLFPGITAASDEVGHEWVAAVDFVYQCAKLMAFGLMLCGTLNFARGAGDWILMPLIAAAVAYAAVSFAFEPSMPTLMMAQAPGIVGTSLLCAWLLCGLRAPRRSLGSRMSSIMFVLIAALWLVYLWALRAGLTRATWQGWVLYYDAYFDLFADVLLAFGMILILLDDAWRETEIAHAQLNSAHEQLRTEVLRDSLTGVLNRRAFNESVGLESAAIGGAIVVFDLDNLKEVNDNYGHKSGDDLLKYFVSVVRPRLRRADKLYRFGGDEFLLVLPEADAEDTTRRMAALLAAAEPLRLPEADAEIALEVSVGAAAFRGFQDLDSAVAQADDAMYEQKRRRKFAFGVREAPVGY